MITKINIFDHNIQFILAILIVAVLLSMRELWLTKRHAARRMRELLHGFRDQKRFDSLQILREFDEFRSLYLKHSVPIPEGHKLLAVKQMAYDSARCGVDHWPASPEEKKPLYDQLENFLQKTEPVSESDWVSEPQTA